MKFDKAAYKIALEMVSSGKNYLEVAEHLAGQGYKGRHGEPITNDAVSHQMRQRGLILRKRKNKSYPKVMRQPRLDQTKENGAITEVIFEVLCMKNVPPELQTKMIRCIVAP